MDAGHDVRLLDAEFGPQAIDREAIRLLRQHGIISMAAWVAGFAQEKDRDYWRTLRQLLAYDPDQIQALYATPHRWTPFAQQQAEQRVIRTDLSRWDYKHQVLARAQVPNWRVMLWVKFIEAASQLRPKALARLLAHPDPRFRAGMRWYSNIGRQVWLYEIWQWFFHDRRTAVGPTVGEFLQVPRLAKATATAAADNHASDSGLLAETSAASPAASYVVDRRRKSPETIRGSSNVGRL